MIDLVCLAIMLLAALGVGRRLLRAVPFEWALEEALFALALGFGLLAHVTLALGEAGLLRRSVVLAVIAVGAAFGWRQIVAGVARLPSGVRSWRASRPSRSERAALAIGALVIVAEVVMVFAPPVGGDQTKYQLVYPRLYAEAHRLVATPWSFWGYLQYLMNMLFTAAFVLRGDVLARLLNVTYGVLLTFAIFALGRRVFSRRTGIWAALLFATMPFTATLMIRAWVEFALTAYVVLAVLALMAWRENGARPWLALAAVMAGFAAGTKVIGLLAPALLGILALAIILERHGARALRAALATTILFGAVAAVVASPSYLRNAVETGNPIYPFGYGVFGGANWSADAARGLDAYYANYRETHAAKREGHAYASWEAVRFPWDLTMAPNSFEDSGRAAYDVGPLLLAFVPGLLLLRRSRAARSAWMLGSVALVYAAIVAFGMWAHPRYVHPALPLLLLVAVEVVDHYRAYGPLAARAVTAVLAFTVLVHVALAARVIAPLWPDSVRVALGRMSDETFLQRNEKRYTLASMVHAHVPADANVLVLGMIPHPYYYVGRHFTLASPLEQAAIDYRRITTVDEFVTALRRFGVTHVVREVEADKPAANPVGDRVVALWDALLAHADKIAEGEGGAVYRLEPALARAEPGQ